MKRTFRGDAALAQAFLLLAALATTPLPGTAQETRSGADCRCVDSKGEEIADCTCLRLPEAEGLVARVLTQDGRARVGITLDPEQPAEADARGARVADLLEDGPADRAGLRDGDVIVRFDGYDLLEPLDRRLEEDLDLDRSIPVQRLMALARRLEPGEEVEVEYLRDDERRRATLEARALAPWNVAPLLRGLRDLPAPGRRFELRLPGVAVPGEACPGGLRLVELNPALGEYFDTDHGVLVLDAPPESPLGLRPGDVIQSIGAREADTPDRVRRILGSYADDEPVTFEIVRDGRSMEVQGRSTP